MRKILVLLFLISIILPISSEENEKEHWFHHLEGLENYINELQEWKKDVEFDDILDQQIALIKEKSEMIQDFISNKIKDDRDLDIKLRLLDAQLEILYLKVSLREVDNKDDSERLKEIYQAIIELKEAMLKLQKKESELILELNKIKRKARIRELEKELERLREE